MIEVRTLHALFGFFRCLPSEDRLVNVSDSLAVTGSLLGWHRGRRLSVRSLESLEGVNIKATTVAGWISGLIRSDKALLGELQGRLVADLRFTYRFFHRKSGERSLLVASGAPLVAYLLDRVKMRLGVFCPMISVPALVEELVERPKEYVLGSVYARVSGYGQSLRTIILYGHDLGDAGLFREIVDAVQPYRVSLRKVQTGTEVVSVGSRGEVSFTYRGDDDLEEVDMVLKYLTDGGFIDWEQRVALR